MKKLAIVGLGPATREQAPFDDPTYDIFVFNEAAQADWCKRWDVLLQLHKPEIYTGHNTKNPKHWQWLQEKHNKPIYMQEVDPRVPDSVRYPLEDAIALSGLRYLCSTICYALALAKLQGYERVDIYGIELSRTEYEYQAANYRFWVGYMLGAGVEINLHSGAPLFKSLLYGYEGNFAFGADYFKGRAAELDKAWHTAEDAAKARKQKLEWCAQKNKFNAFPDAMREFQEAMQASGVAAGALAEAERYAVFGDRFADRGGFEYAAAKSQQEGEALKVIAWRTSGMVELIWDSWRNLKTKPAAVRLMQFASLCGEKSYDMGAQLGMYRENVGYLNKYDDMAQANGLVRTEK
jgi:hypothetical protein